MKQGKILFAALAATVLGGGSALAFDKAQYDLGVPQTTNGVTFVKIVADITNDTRWTANNVYVLDKALFVQSPATLTIEPGTIVRGEKATTAGSATNAADVGALIVNRGAKLNANGTKESPIVFTSIDDSNVAGGTSTVPPYENASVVTQRYYGANISYTNPLGGQENGFKYQAEWGGLLVCGNTRVANRNTTGVELDANAPTNRNAGVGMDIIEGLQFFAGNGVYGGSNDDDNSGVLRFLSVRYAGYVLSTANELNGLTMGGVGRGTTIEFVEIFNNQDDGFEWFGGTVNTKYLVSLFNGDDQFDWDEGFRGQHQFWFCLMDDTGTQPGATITGRGATVNEAGDNMIEGDGGEDVPTYTSDTVEANRQRPFSIPKIWNATLIGRQTNATIVSGNAVRLRANSGLKLHNAFVMDAYSTADSLRLDETPNLLVSVNVTAANTNFYTADRMLFTRTLGDEYGFNPAVYGAVTEPDMIFTNVTFFNSFNDTPASEVRGESGFEPAMLGILTNAGYANTWGVAPGIGGIGRYSNGILDPRLQAASQFRTNAATPPANGFLTPVAFRGACRDFNWMRGWTMLEKLNVFTNAANVDDGPAVGIDFTSGGDPIVSFATAANVLYSIEGSTDLKAYSPLTVVTGTGSTVVFTNAGAGSVTNFYRVLPL